MALWGLARIAMKHNEPEAYRALTERMADRRAEVRLTAIDLNLDAYLVTQRSVPAHLVAVVEQMALTDPDKDVRRVASKVVREPWMESK